MVARVALAEASFKERSRFRRSRSKVAEDEGNVLQRYSMRFFVIETHETDLSG